MKVKYLIDRELYTKITEKLYRGRALIVTGPRQVGKTTLIRKILSTSGKNFIEFTGDEPDIRSLLNSPTSTRIKDLIAGAQIVCIDEAQRIPNIGITLKLIVDQIPEVQVIASGSSSFELAAGISEALTGRKFEFQLLPLSWKERSDYFGRLEEKRLLEKRLIFGSYPEITLAQNEERDLLQELAGSYLYRDLLTLDQLRKPAVLDKLLQALALQVGSEVSFQELSRTIGIDNQTIERYVDLLEKAFVIFRLPAFSRNIRNEIRKGKKFYFYDNGIRNAVINNFSPLQSRSDTGALWENYLISERIKKLFYRNPYTRSYFWRTTQQQEVDYIEEHEGELSGWEFKWNPYAKSRSLPRTFTRNYKPRATEIITPDNYEGFLH